VNTIYERMLTLFVSTNRLNNEWYYEPQCDKTYPSPHVDVSNRSAWCRKLCMHSLLLQRYEMHSRQYVLVYIVEYMTVHCVWT